MSNSARWSCSTGSGDDRLISVQRGYVCGKCTRYEDRSRKRRRDGVKVFLSCAIISLVLVSGRRSHRNRICHPKRFAHIPPLIIYP